MANDVTPLTCAPPSPSDLPVDGNRDERLLSLLWRSLRDSASDDEAMAIGTSLLAAHFDAIRVCYAEVEADGDHAHIRHEWLGRGASSHPARLRLSDQPHFKADYAAGQAIAVDDCSTDPRTAAAIQQGTGAANGVLAQAVAPVKRLGRLVALLYVDLGKPRRWCAQDLELVAEVAEWTWWVIDEFRAVEMLRENERRLGFLLRLLQDQRATPDARAIIDETCRALALYLGADCVAMARMEASDSSGTALATWCADDHRRRLADRAAIDELHACCAQELRNGATVVIADTAAHPLTRNARLAGFGHRAVLGVPVLRKGRMCAVMSAHHAEFHEWNACEVTLVREVADQTWDAVERAETAAELREHGRRQTFFVRLGDVLRRLNDAGEIQSTAAQMLGEYLGADRVFFSDLPSEGDDTLSMTWAWDRKAGRTSGPTDSAQVTETLISQLRRGQPVVISGGPRASQDTGQEGPRSQIIVPIGRAGHLLGCAGVQQGSPRDWHPEDVSLVDETAQRTWGSVKRARAEAALREADRRKDEFIAMLGHELRNPLAPIRCGLRILRLLPKDAPAANKALDTMDRQLTHLVRLLDDLLDASRISRGKLELQLEPLDIAGVVENAVETNRPLIDAAQQELVVLGAGETLEVMADPVRLVQVFANLLNNASKYTHKAGHIEVQMAREDREAVVRVSDDGIGLSGEMAARVFDMFTQVNPGRSHGGLGVGLAVAKRLVEMHGGSLQVTSAGANQGSQFTVRLPLRAGPGQEAGTPKL